MTTTPSHTATGGLETVTATEAARLLAIHRNTLDRLIARGDIPAHKIGRSVRIRKTDLENYLQANTWLPTN
ncbi:helix-turn-helix domain-containing protein [Trueperella pyogenes]|uniref:helix-turn-helix domain-containing protein n=1 Tax=Trueperella pyogenes TaxID=1661 RepID=UPI00345DB85C